LETPGEAIQAAASVRTMMSLRIRVVSLVVAVKFVTLGV
jgi:hypothetical protein